MKSIVIGLLLAFVLSDSATCLAIDDMNEYRTQASNQYVIKVSSLDNFNLSTLPYGSKVLSIHSPYSIIVVENSELSESEMLRLIADQSDILRIEMALTDQAGSPVYPTGTVIYEPIQDMSFECARFCEELGCLPSREFEALGWSSVELPSEVSFKDFELMATQSGLFSKLMRDEIIVAQEHTSNDPLYSSAWHVSQLSDKDIDADEAWTLLPAQTSIQSVAVIDGHGFDTAHPDMVGQWSDTYNAVDQTTNVFPVSTNEKHGTACAGIPGAIYNNAIGTPGLGYNYLRVQAIKIGYNPTSSGSFSTSSLIQADAINRTMLNSNTVSISMSFGGSTYQTTFYNAITNARTTGRSGKGIVVFGSTGNSGSATWTNYPASYAGVVAIGSSSTSDFRSSFSNYGTGLTFAAPGSSISTIDVSGANGYSATDYTNFTGTSAACPVAASVGAIVIAANPTLTETQVKQYLAESCEKVGGYVYSSSAANPLSTWSAELGYGRINMKNAVQAAIATVVINPDVTITSASINNASPVAGQTVTINATQNINPANGAAVSPVLEYRWSTDQIWSASDVLIGTDVSALGGGLSSESESITFVVPTGTGTRYVLVSADNTALVTEANENNNIAVITVNVSSAVVLPDITVTGLTADDTTPLEGQTVQISCNQNITSPSTSSGNIIIEYRYSTDATWSTNDIIIGTDTSSLGTNLTASAENISFTIPTGTGTRYILAKADNTGVIAESNENNNTVAIILTVSAPVIVPDISLTQISATATSTIVGQSVTVLCQQMITNGSTTPVSVNVEYRWSADQVWSTSDVLLGTSTSSLSSSSSAESESVTFNVPNTTGTYYVLLRADAGNVVTETNESNTYNIQFTVSIAATTPDIFVNSTAVSTTTVTVGQSISVDCLQNISLPNAPAVNVFLEYRWATSATFSSSYPIIGIDYSSLGAGDPNDPENLLFTVPSGTGQRYVMIICDTGNNVAESNESNNIVLMPVNVISASFELEELPIEYERAQDETDESIAADILDETSVSFSIYPNPATDHISITRPENSTGTLSFSIFDMNGSLIMNQQFSDSFSINDLDISGITAGTYVIVMKDDVNLNTSKLMITR